MHVKLAQWLLGHDTGSSSKAIAAYLMGTRQGYFQYPRDPSDFGRCYRLLALDPLFKISFVGMAEVSPEWNALISHWSELEALWLEESAGARAPKLYARMRELIDGAKQTA